MPKNIKLEWVSINNYFCGSNNANVKSVIAYKNRLLLGDQITQMWNVLLSTQTDYYWEMK